MTTRDVMQGTGISPAVIRADVRRGDLDARKVNGRLQFEPEEVFSWAVWCWSCRNLMMHPPFWTKKFIETFCKE